MPSGQRRWNQFFISPGTSFAQALEGRAEVDEAKSPRRLLPAAGAGHAEAAPHGGGEGSVVAAPLGDAPAARTRSRAGIAPDRIYRMNGISPILGRLIILAGSWALRDSLNAVNPAHR